ncbi:DUF2612 domain-containing protein [Pasteurella caecimuris]|uniref:DUF2612 domain-containing protein n=1 Tax=Rodentibacter caecimuris TaxID=1796644 RepID=UPI00214F723B|nr:MULTISPECIES: DUF2612 domain-containing protein [Pasteurellaceae]MCR1838619.1 DUF2612 domain-containing protein [Pasteurella caecimuris]MCU0107916.1 DUF2612 domain-containing protein [Pasteurella caecimuris]MCX2960282.1 DUF2612 domain-containing protein [Rodentibacter heylii]
MTIQKALSQDFEQAAWENQLAQFRYSPNLQKLFHVLFKPYQSLQLALKQNLEQRDLESAKGKQLDGIGDIVGLPRPYINRDGEWYFGFRGQSKGKGFSQAPIRDLALLTNNQKIQFMADEPYRRLLRWKIIANNSQGTLEDVINACLVLFKASRVIVREVAPCNVEIQIERALKDQIMAIEQNPSDWIPIGVGISTTVIFKNKE